MLAVDLKLVLLLLAFTAALVEVQGTCCYSKKLNGKTYTRIEQNSDEVSEYGCDTKDSCIYEEKGSDTGDRYCFKRGGQEVPDCVQKLPFCAKYFAQPVLHNPDETQHFIRTYPYNVADRDAGTCAIPKLPGPAFKDVQSGTLFSLGGDLLLMGPAAEWKSKKLEGDSWKLNNFATETSNIGFPDKDYVVSAGNTALYAVGGYRTSSSGIVNTVFKSEDGFNWKKLPWTLAKARGTSSSFYSCITQNEESGNENLVVMGGLGSGDKSIEVHDLATETLVIDIQDAGFTTGGSKIQLVCHGSWMYVADIYNDLRMLKLKNEAVKDDITKISYATLAKEGQLVVYDNKIGLVGGKTDTGFDNHDFVYYDHVAKALKTGAEFPAAEVASPTNPLVPLVTK